MKCTIVFEKNWDAIHALNPDGTRKYRYIINEGSSRSSKTTSLIDCYDLYARSYPDKRLTVWRDTKTDCKKTVLSDVLKHLKKTKRYKRLQDFNKTESIFTYATDSTFEIHGTDDEETVHGLTQSVAWFNEPYKIGRDTFDQIDQRTEDFIFLDWNPKKDHFIDSLKKDPRTLVIHSTFKDNPFCPVEEKIKILSYQPVPRCQLVIDKLLTEQTARAYDIAGNPNGYSSALIKELTRCRENEAKDTANDWKWCVYGLGTKGERPNRIFKWTEVSDEVYKALSVPEYMGVDWGTVHPWGILSAKYYDGGLYLHERNYKSENEIRSNLHPAELAQINADDEGMVTWMFRKLGIHANTEIICDNNRPLKVAALRRSGWESSFLANKAPGSILDGIDLLSNIRVYYTASSENIAYEQENYSRKVDSNGVVLEEPEDMDNHLIDPTRYVASFLVAQGIIRRL